MKLSIVTINLNNASGFKKTAESIISQTFQDFEWIVIDGGSTDVSIELITQYSDHIHYWVSEKDSGIYNAMNKGVRHAEGEYVQFLNSGDWLLTDSILDEVFAKKFSAGIVYCNAQFYKDSQLRSFEKYPEFLSLNHFLVSTICHNASFIRRDLLIKNPYDEKNKIVSDWKFFLLEKISGTSYKYLDKFVCGFDMSGISLTMTDLVSDERRATYEELSSSIIEYQVKQSRMVSSCLAHLSSEEFVELCSSHRLLRKIITAAVLLMKRFK